MFAEFPVKNEARSSIKYATKQVVFPFENSKACRLSNCNFLPILREKQFRRRQQFALLPVFIYGKILTVKILRRKF